MLEGKVAVITGASQGLGLAIAKKFAASGAKLMICARGPELLQRAHRELEDLVGDPERIVASTTNVSKADEVRACIEMTLQKFGHIDILVNNAGVYGPMGPVEEVSWNDWVDAIEINLYGSVLMAREVVPHLKKQGRGKIVQLSGGGATKPLSRLSAYAVSKAAVIRFIETLAEEVRENHIDVNAIAPGALNTRMLEEVLAAGAERVGADFYERSIAQKRDGGAPLDRGADLAVFLASSLSDGITGKLLSAIWDPWSRLPDYVDDLRSTDIYTLRRIEAADRGRNWGDGE